MSASAIRKAAAVAAENGDEGPYWKIWWALAVTADRDFVTALAELREHEAFWLASWCWSNEREEPGLLAYERFLASKLAVGNDTETIDGHVRVGLNYFKTFTYALVALRLGEHVRALRAFAPVHELIGGRPSDDLVLAALRFLGGSADRDATRKLVARFTRDSTPIVRAACAVVQDVIGDHAGARAALAAFDRTTPIAKGIQHELERRFGAAFTEAIARAAAPATPKKKREPGFIVVPSKAKTPHVFAPNRPAGPPCHGCARPLRVWFALDLASVPPLAARLPSWPAFDVPACFDCNEWMLRHDFLVGRGGVLTLEDVEEGPKSLGTPRSEDSTRAIPTRFVKLAKAPRDLDERPLDGHCQLGGDPAWIQDPVELHCRKCDREMVFVFRLSAPNDLEGLPEVAGGSGALYYFACTKCRRFTSIAQWT